MRTTLTLDDGIADALRERARVLNRPFRRVVNDALRRGLESVAEETPLPPYRVVPHRSAFAPGVDPLRLKELDEELEAERFLAPGAG